MEASTRQSTEVSTSNFHGSFHIPWKFPRKRWELAWKSRELPPLPSKVPWKLSPTCTKQTSNVEDTSLSQNMICFILCRELCPERVPLASNYPWLLACWVKHTKAAAMGAPATVLQTNQRVASSTETQKCCQCRYL